MTYKEAFEKVYANLNLYTTHELSILHGSIEFELREKLAQEAYSAYKIKKS